MAAIVCPSCFSSRVTRIGGIRPAFVFASHRLSEKLDGGSLYRCSDCALGFRHPTPSAEILDRLYRTSNIEHWQYNPEKRLDWRCAIDWLENQSGRTILDIGCYDGAFLQELGPGWESYGIEINEQARERARARGIAVIARDLYEMAGIDRQFDAVTAFDVIEHVRNPADLLACMSAITRSDGSIIIATGNLDAPSWKTMGSAYWYCTIPEHLVFASEAWCRNVASRLGLQLASIHTYSHEQNRTLRLALHELASNVLYRFAPSLFAAMRRAGVGDKDVLRHEELAYYPPTWTTAKDHFIAIFRKV